mmetsp:Transcript_46862/g.123913  ORF Transcript_46862/g.123913 Transcript_46862/m.123913 type:complete len:342 (+) Transcript_46862:1018-2043(+)
MTSLASFDTKRQCFDVRWHPTLDLLSVCTLNGHVELLVVDRTEWTIGSRGRIKMHKGSCRESRFFPGGQHVVSGGADGQAVVSDLEGGKVCKKSAGGKLNCLHVMGEQQFATGDDSGVVKVWDVRQKQPSYLFEEHEEFVTGITSDPVGKFLLSTSGDGKLSWYDLRKRGGALKAMSDEFDEELTCVELMMSGSKVITGCGVGQVQIFNWGDFGYRNDVLVPFSDAVEKIAKLDEFTFLTGGPRGILRAARLSPNAVLGVAGFCRDSTTSELPGIDGLCASPDSALAAVVSDDHRVRVFDVAQYGAQESGGPAPKRRKVVKGKRLEAAEKVELAKGFFDDV